MLSFQCDYHLNCTVYLNYTVMVKPTRDILILNLSNSIGIQKEKFEKYQMDVSGDIGLVLFS